MPPILKEWPVNLAAEAWDQIVLHLAKNIGFVRVVCSLLRRNENNGKLHDNSNNNTTTILSRTICCDKCDNCRVLEIDKREPVYSVR